MAWLRRGRADAAAALATLVTETRADEVVLASVNGDPGLALMGCGTGVAVLTAQARSGLLCETWVVTNPDKLTRWNRRSSTSIGNDPCAQPVHRNRLEGCRVDRPAPPSP